MMKHATKALIEPPDAGVLNITPDENSRRLVRYVGRCETVSRMSWRRLSFCRALLGTGWCFGAVPALSLTT
jgi:hypothetical protein